MNEISHKRRAEMRLQRHFTHAVEQLMWIMIDNISLFEDDSYDPENVRFVGKFWDTVVIFEMWIGGVYTTMCIGLPQSGEDDSED